MTEKTLKSKKEEIAIYHNNYKNSKEVKVENEKRLSLNSFMNEFSLQDIINDIERVYSDFDFKIYSEAADKQTIEIKNRDSSYYKGTVINIYKDKPESISLPRDNISISPQDYSISLTQLKKELEVAENLLETIEKSLEQQSKHKIIENTFEKNWQKVDYRKLIDQIEIEEKNRAYQGHVYLDLKSNKAYVISRFSAYKTYGRQIDFDNKKIFKEEELYSSFRFGNIADKNCNIYSHTDYDENLMKEIPTEDWIENIVPQIKQNLTFENFCEEFKYRVNLLNYNVHENRDLRMLQHYNLEKRNKYLNNDEQSQNAYGLLGKYIINKYENKDEFKDILVKNGINTKKDLMNLFVKLSEESILLGIEKTAKQLIFETAKKTEDIKLEKTNIFDLDSIKKELNQMIQTGNFGELQTVYNLNQAFEIIKTLEKDGYYPDFNWLDKKDNDDKFVYDFFKSRNGITLQKSEFRGYFSRETYASTALFSNEGVVKYLGKFPSSKILNEELFKKEHLIENINALLIADSRLKQQNFNGDVCKAFFAIRANMKQEVKDALDKEFDISNSKALEQKLKSSLSKLSTKIKSKADDDTRGM